MNVLRVQINQGKLFREYLEIFDQGEKRRIFRLALAQTSLGVFDLLGIATIGLIGALSATGLRSLQPEGTMSRILQTFNLENFTFQTQVAILAVFGSVTLIAKTILSIYLTRRIIHFLSFKSSEIGFKYFQRFISLPFQYIKTKEVQETVYNFSGGIQSIVFGIIANAVTIIADSALLFLITFLLFIVQPITALTTLLFFVSVAVVIHLSINRRVSNLGKLESETNIQANALMVGVLGAYKEIFVRQGFEIFLSRIQSFRDSSITATATLSFVPNLSKYIMESSVILGAILIAGIQFAVSDATEAFASLAMFIVASSRIVPAIMRLQNSYVSFKTNIGRAEITRNLMLEIDSELRNIPEIISTSKINLEGFRPSIRLSGVSVQYKNNLNPSLKNVNLYIEPGTSVAIVGPSGSGKSTLVNAMLGILTPTSGEVLIGDYPPRHLIASSPGIVGYMPQEPVIFERDVISNLVIGISEDSIKQFDPSDALKRAQIFDYNLTEHDNLFSLVGNGGTSLSGGQRQRLAIARSILTNPKILILDEATSSLDGQMEFQISKELSKFGDGKTVVIIAHRLSTVRDADQIIYLDKGEIKATGTFDEVRKAIPDFDSQASLMGL